MDVLPRAAQATKEPMLWLLWQTAAADGRHCATLLDLPGAVAKVVAVLRERPEKGGDVALWRAKRCACGLLGLIAYQSRAAQQRLAENDCLLPLMSVVTYPFGEPQIPPPKPKKRPAAEAAPAPDAPPAGKGKGKDAKGGKGAKQQPQPEPEPEPETESEPDPMPVMMDDVAARPDWVRCVEEACSALKNLLYENRELQESMLARDGVAVAMRAMRMDDEGVSAAACNLMRIMCRAPALQARFLEDPGILKASLRRKRSELQCAAQRSAGRANLGQVQHCTGHVLASSLQQACAAFCSLHSLISADDAVAGGFQIRGGVHRRGCSGSTGGEADEHGCSAGRSRGGRAAQRRRGSPPRQRARGAHAARGPPPGGRHAKRELADVRTGGALRSAGAGARPRAGGARDGVAETGPPGRAPHAGGGECTGGAE